MSRDLRKLSKVYDVNVSLYDTESFAIRFCGTTRTGRDVAFEAIIPFSWIVYITRDMARAWLAARNKRITEINQIDAALPKGTQP